jgi:hypothetical protein
MKIFVTLLIALISFSSMLSGCGVIFGGSKFAGSILVKDHPKAQIYVDGSKIGQGSAVGIFSRNRPLAVQVKQEGCESKTQTFDKTFRTGNFILSFLTWGLLGAAVDLGTGASFKPDHKNNPAIQKLTDKNFVFMVDFSECPSNP